MGQYMRLCVCPWGRGGGVKKRNRQTDGQTGEAYMMAKTVCLLVLCSRLTYHDDRYTKLTPFTFKW